MADPTRLDTGDLLPYEITVAYNLLADVAQLAAERGDESAGYALARATMYLQLYRNPDAVVPDG